MINKDLSLLGRFSSWRYSETLMRFTLASDSIIPSRANRHSRLSYKRVDEFSIDRLQFNSFCKSIQEYLHKFSAGIFERMFGGYGGEFLYRPFEKNYGVGFEAWRVRQRDYKQNLTFRDYETSTGHVTFYFTEPNSGVLIRLKGWQIFSWRFRLYIGYFQEI